MLFPKVWVYTHLPFLRHKLAYKHHHTQKILTFHLYTNLSNKWFKPHVEDHSKWTHFLKVKFGLQFMIHLVNHSNHTHTHACCTYFGACHLTALSTHLFIFMIWLCYLCIVTYCTLLHCCSPSAITPVHISRRFHNFKLKIKLFLLSFIHGPLS